MNMYILGLKYIKSHAKRVMYLSIIIVFSLVSLVSMSIATKSQMINAKKFIDENSALYGAVANDIDKTTLENIENSKRVDKVYQTKNIGEFIENNGKILLLEEYNKKVNEISKLKLVLGRLPINDEEAILLDGTGNHKIGDYIDGVVKVNYEENGINKIRYISKKIKITGIVYNKIKSTEMRGIDQLYIKMGDGFKNIIPDKFNAYISFKTGFKDPEGESYGLNTELNLPQNLVTYNKILTNTENTYKQFFIASPDTKNLILAGILFPLVFLFIASRDVFADAALLRVVGSSKKIVFFIFGLENVLIILISNIISFILSYYASLIYMKKVNFTLFSDNLFRLMDKSIHMDYRTYIISFIISIIPFAIVFLYEFYVINNLSVVDLTNYNHRRKKINRILLRPTTKIHKKLLLINIQKNAIYLMVPVIMLSLSLSRYVININKDYFDKNVDSSVNFLMGREYNLTNLSNIYRPKSNLNDRNIGRFRDDNRIKNIVTKSSKEAYFISNGKMFNEYFLNDRDLNGKEIETVITGVDDDFLIKNGFIRNDKFKSTSEYPVAYLRSKVHNKLEMKMIPTMKNIKVGDVIKIKVAQYSNGREAYKTKKIIVGGFIDDLKWSRKVVSQLLLPEIITDTDNFKKLVGYGGADEINFNYNGNSKNLRAHMDKVLGKNNYKIISETEFKQIDQYEHRLLMKNIIVNSIYISVLSIITIYTSLNMIFEQRKRENTIMRYIGLSKKSMIFMYIKESVFWAIVSGAIMFGIVSYKSIHDYLVNIKYLGDGYKMIFSFQTVSLATLYVSVLFVLVFIVVLKKRIEE